jgi:hypothetical protein
LGVVPSFATIGQLAQKLNRHLGDFKSLISSIFRKKRRQSVELLFYEEPAENVGVNILVVSDVTCQLVISF